MKIVFAGCTGFIGSRLVERLAADGHECTVLTRTSQPQTANRFGPGVKLSAYSEMPDSADAVVNLAGEPIVGRWTVRKKALIINTRVDITRDLVHWMGGLTQKPSVFLSSSAVGYYGDHGRDPITEEMGPDPHNGFRCQVCRAWEEAANEASGFGTRVVILRTGNVLDPAGGMLAAMKAKFRPAPFIVPHATGAYLPWITLDDVVGIVRFAISHESVSGPVNLAAPTTATWSEFYDGLGVILRRRVVGKLPGWVLGLAVGEFSKALVESQRIVPEKIVREGYVFQDVSLIEYLSRLKAA